MGNMKSLLDLLLKAQPITAHACHLKCHEAEEGNH